jgi:tetratricopeptide (TPR) repeat protein
MNVLWLAAIPLSVGAHFLVHGIRVENAIKRCRYRHALKMTVGPLGWSKVGIIRLLRADALFFSGRAAEAEPILRELTGPAHDAADRLMGSERLGRVLLALGRYEDAREAFETATSLRPTRSAAFSGLAEMRLLQGSEPVAALADAERALENHRAARTESTSRERLAAIRGNQAWALALLGRNAGAEEAIEAGRFEIDPEYKPEAAGFYWRAGMAMMTIQNASAAAAGIAMRAPQESSAAAAYFRQAVELDPHGYYGTLAAGRLR